MDGLMQLKHKIWVQREILTSRKKDVANIFLRGSNGDGMDVVNRVLQLLDVIEAKLDTCIPARIIDKELEKRLKLGLSPLQSFLEDYHMIHSKGVSGVFQGVIQEMAEEEVKPLKPMLPHLQSFQGEAGVFEQDFTDKPEERYKLELPHLDFPFQGEDGVFEQDFTDKPEERYKLELPHLDFPFQDTYYQREAGNFEVDITEKPEERFKLELPRFKSFQGTEYKDKGKAKVFEEEIKEKPEESLKLELPHFEHFPVDYQNKGKAKVFEEETQDFDKKLTETLLEKAKVKPENVLEPLVTLVKFLDDKRPLPMTQDMQQPEVSWILFKTKAFRDDEKGINNPILLEIAWEFYDKFQHVPSVLKSITSLFSSKHSVKEWENLRDNVISSTKDASETNLFNLSLSSYTQLQSNIQKCVCYCSLFPKDYTFNKISLVHLWDSQEHLASVEGKPEELVGDLYFEELLKKGYFFEYIDATGDILGYKMPYLVNEFLKEMGKPEFCIVDESTGEIEHNSNTLHLSFIVNSSWKAPSWLFTAKKLRSLFFLPRKLHEDSAEVPNLKEIFSSLICLRALDLVAVNCECLPSTLGELKELRYLRFGISFENLPEGVTRLENLRTLDLRYSSVMVLPSGFHTLLNSLKHLYTGSRLIDMPGEIIKSFQMLDEFIISGNDGLDALTSLNKLITKLTFRGWKRESNLQEQLNNKLSILENLVSVCIEDCSSCRDLSHLSSLPYLRSLRLWDLNALVYIDNDDDDDKSKAATTYFPSLQYLMLANLPELKGWSSRKQQQPIRSRCLRIKGCPKMTTVPPLPNLESLEAHYIPGPLLQELLYNTQIYPQGIIFSSPPTCKLKKLEVVSFVELDSASNLINIDLELLTIRQCPKLKNLSNYSSMKSLQQLEIHECGGLEDITSTFENLSALQKLVIKRCEKLKWGDRNSGIAWEDLRRLHSFKVINISNLASLETGLVRVKCLREFSLHSLYGLNALPEWIGRLTQLRRLAIRNCPLLTTLPESLGHLSGLQQLEIECCPRIRKVPKSFSDLSSLKQLKIQQCAKLVKRCQELNGEDFHLIKHVPDLILLE